jgi:hypothetical protein
MLELLQGDDCSKYMSKAHIFELIGVAASDSSMRIRSAELLLEEAFGDDLPDGLVPADMIYKIGCNTLREAVLKLVYQKLKALLTLEYNAVLQEAQLSWHNNMLFKYIHRELSNL